MLSCKDDLQNRAERVCGISLHTVVGMVTSGGQRLAVKRSGMGLMHYRGYKCPGSLDLEHIQVKKNYLQR